MKSLYEYLKPLFEEEAGAGVASPGSVTGMGEPSFNTDGIISAPAGGLPKEKTTIYRRKKKKKKGQPDFVMDPNKDSKSKAE